MNAFFVAAEFALVKIHATQLETRARKGDRRAVAALAVVGRLDRFLSVTQFGITVASLGLGWIGEPAVGRFADNVSMRLTGAALGPTGHIVVDVLGLTLLTFFHLLLGELVPKFVAIQYSEGTVLRSARLLQLVDTVFRPLLWFLEHAQNAVLRLIGIDPMKANEGTMSEEEIIGILAATAGRSESGRDKRKIVERVLRFAGRPVKQLMVPRVDVFALPIDTPGAAAIELLRAHGFSRIPLEESTPDEVVGYLYAKDLLFEHEGHRRKTLRGLERPAHFVPESRDGLSVLRDMQRTRTPLAIVIDEYGGTSVIVTLEDLVEEIVGEIKDELDVEPDAVVMRSTNPATWEVEANATMEDLRDAGVPLDDAATGEHVGKIVVDRLGHLPHVGDVAMIADGVLAEVIATSRRRVRRILVRVTPEEEAAEGEPAPVT
jgi:CBS domain containing-hemolysin-like protein